MTNSTIKNQTDYKSQVRACTRCNSEDLEYPCPGYGTIASPIVVLGQSLCKACVNKQIPFTEGSGDFLDTALAHCHIRKEWLYWTNVVKCHPVRNRPSKGYEKLRCTPFLMYELHELVRPKVLIALGGDAKLAARSPSLQKCCDFQTFGLYHPAYYLPHRKGNPDEFIKSFVEVINTCSSIPEVAQYISDRQAGKDYPVFRGRLWSNPNPR